MAGSLIDVVFFIGVLVISIIFTYLSLHFNPKRVEGSDLWKGPVFALIGFVSWTSLGSIHSFVCASFEATGLISLGFLWYGLGAVMLIYSIVLIFQIFLGWQDSKTLKVRPVRD